MLNSTNKSLNITLNGKGYAIGLEPLLAEVQEGLKSLCEGKKNNEIEPLELLKAYITKAQEYAKLCQNLESLYQTLENIAPQGIQIHSLESH